MMSKFESNFGLVSIKFEFVISYYSIVFVVICII